MPKLSTKVKKLIEVRLDAVITRAGQLGRNDALLLACGNLQQHVKTGDGDQQIAEELMEKIERSAAGVGDDVLATRITELKEYKSG